MDGGRTRLKLDLRDNFISVDFHDKPIPAIKFRLKLEHSFDKIWLSQSSKIFNELNVIDIDKECYWLFERCYFIEIKSRSVASELGNPLCEGHVYLFIEPPFISLTEDKSWRTRPHFWSHNETGDPKMSEEECAWLYLPEVTVTRPNSIRHYWPEEVYKAIEEWQIARGFDPKTSDWAQSMGYPEMEVVGTRRPNRFEEVVDNTPDMPRSWKD
ncbi:hypothetical protein VNI00_007272 [Paramarasmius palmivorus]|uniref:Uncharacterized protein n=1 Tax=Paramarasmius palmivorus TaxID=297713 RepID=A0AAW0D4U7_9AGAR